MGSQRSLFGRKILLHLTLCKIVANWFSSVMLVWMDVEILIQHDRKNLIPYSLRNPIFLQRCCIGFKKKKKLKKLK